MMLEKYLMGNKEMVDKLHFFLCQSTVEDTNNMLEIQELGGIG